MRIPKSEFTDSDLRLCRAHGASVAHGRVMTASQPHDDAEWSRRWERAEAIAAFQTEICMPADLPLPPNYDEDLEHWLKTLVPAKPASPKPEPTADVWHSEAPSVPGVYIADTKECVSENSEKASRWLRYFDGMLWSNAWDQSMADIDKARTRGLRTGAEILWLRLIEADAPAQEKPAHLTHSVCIKAHHGVKVGRVVDGSRPLGYPKLWLPCDASGWIPHTPTADSVCPVPAGVRFEARYGNGQPVNNTELTRHGVCTILWRSTTGSAPRNDIVAWRPIAKDAS